MAFGRLDPVRIDVDRGVVDDGVDAADGVGLVRKAAGVRGAGQIAEHDTRRTMREVLDSARSRRVPCVQDDLVSVVEELLCRGPSQPGGGPVISTRAMGQRRWRVKKSSRLSNGIKSTLS